MEKLSGLVLDIYDDRDGETLRTIFPDSGELPEVVKEAHFLSSDEHSRLPDDVYALVLVDGDTSLRKYACTDAGNTSLSVEYFLKMAHKLPVEAQKVAAANLVKACGWYDIDPPDELTKVAIGLGGLVMGALTVPGAVKETQANLRAVKGSKSRIVTPAQMRMMRGGY